MLIHDAELWGHGVADLRVAKGVVAEIGRLQPRAGERRIDARGGALLPGLHDHHIHLAALAARAASVLCGPPEVLDARGLAEALDRPGTGWLRGVGYHESVTGLPTARDLDRLVADRPLRIQHRSGRLWLLNTPALAALLAANEAPAGLDRATGHLFDEDAWLQRALADAPPDLGDVSANLARRGIVGVTDMTPRNDPAQAAYFAAQMAKGALLQRCMLAGALSLAEAQEEGWLLGPAKLHLHEAALPDFDETVRFVRAAHQQARAVAVHCVSEVELVFALAALEQARARAGDRIEHASVAAPDLVERMSALGLAACVQPRFVFERGDRYLADVEPRHQPDLYRLRSLVDAGIALAGGSDAPFGSADPWAAMASALARSTRDKAIVGAQEALTPEQALALFLADPADLGRQRQLRVDGPADLTLIDRPWHDARADLSRVAVRATVVSGNIVHEAPV